MHLPWKRWLEIAAQEELHMIGWEDRIMPPGPGFDTKKLGAGEVHDIAGSYVESALNGSDDYEALATIRKKMPMMVGAFALMVVISVTAMVKNKFLKEPRMSMMKCILLSGEVLGFAVGNWHFVAQCTKVGWKNRVM
jgi:hypothetical protein